MVQLQSVWAHAEAVAQDEVDEVAEAQAVPLADVAVTQPRSESHAAMMFVKPPMPAVVVEPEAPTTAIVPDLSGKSVRAARKQLKALGLRMVVRDRYNDKISRDEWGAYKIRRQKTEAGTEVELGSRVRLKARMRRSFAKGY